MIDDLNKLRKMMLEEPDKLRELLLKNPDALEVLVNADKRYKLIDRAKVDSVDGYCAFYELIHGFPPPQHVKSEIEIIYKAHSEGVGSIIFAWRGSWKSVSISTTFIAYRIGQEPNKTNIVVSANDDSAEKVTKAIAAIIQYHPSWKLVFPNVVPDEGRWSVEGYSVIDNSAPREEWARKQSGVIDPTLIGGGYKSSRLIGKHPSGVLDIDDIHDRDNALSERERKAVVDILFKTILKTVIKENDQMTTWLIAVGTPWALDDAYYSMKNTGQYDFISIPAMVASSEGEEGAVYIDGVNRDGAIFEDIIGWWKLTFPQHYGPKTIIKERADNKSVFWQMVMMDLAQANSAKLIYQPFPYQKIETTWPTIGGVDPTTFEEAPEGNRNSFFALAYVSKLPSGGAVVVDGVLEQCSQSQAENYILAAQGKFPNWQYVAVENVGVGKVFLQTLQRNARIIAIPSGLKGITNGKVSSKRDRVLLTHKWFENGTVTISSADTPFLNALRRLFEKFYDLDPKHDYSFDAFDSVFHALRNMPEVLSTQEAGIPEKRVKKQRPLDRIGRHVGYGV